MGNPLMHLVCYVGSFPLVQPFLDGGLQNDIARCYFGSSLLAAIFSRHHQIINFLLDRDIDTNIISLKHGIALYYACRNNNTDIIHALLDHRANVNADGANQESPLAALLSYKNSSYSIKNSLNLLLHKVDNFRIRTEDLYLVVSTSSSCLNKGPCGAFFSTKQPG
jgi:ankyrin repeat protein